MPSVTDTRGQYHRPLDLTKHSGACSGSSRNANMRDSKKYGGERGRGISGPKTITAERQTRLLWCVADSSETNNVTIADSHIYMDRIVSSYPATICHTPSSLTTTYTAHLGQLYTNPTLSHPRFDLIWLTHTKLT